MQLCIYTLLRNKASNCLFKEKQLNKYCMMEQQLHLVNGPNFP